MVKRNNLARGIENVFFFFHFLLGLVRCSAASPGRETEAAGYGSGGINSARFLGGEAADMRVILKPLIGM